MTESNIATPTLLIETLQERGLQSGLRPFGDGPLEKEIADQLRSSHVPDDLQRLLENAMELSMASVLTGPNQESFETLASISLVSRFADIQLPLTVGEMASIIVKKDTAGQAQRALASLLRSIARTGTNIDTVLIQRLLDQSDYSDLHPACVELLARSGETQFVPALVRLMRERNDVDQLIWTLCHLPDAAYDLALAVTPQNVVTSVATDDLVYLRKQISAALKDIDPSGAALERWEELLRRASEDAKKTFKTVSPFSVRGIITGKSPGRDQRLRAGDRL